MIRMKISEQEKIKRKIFSINQDKWFGSDFDVRFYLISKLHNQQNKKILDIGGGIGIISSEVSKRNDIVNLDMDLKDLTTCIQTNKKIKCICGSMKKLPFLDKSFDVVISSSVIQYGKLEDKKLKQNMDIKAYPSVEKSIQEIYRVLKPGGLLFLVTQNNSYYNTYMLDYNELNQVLKRWFSSVKISFFNTYPRFSKRFRKLDLSVVIPKVKSKIYGIDKTIDSLLTDHARKNYSVSFYVEIKKNE
jgi:ubiquinone/menaquinone biosynthesis C-methylase UbiE